MPAISRSRGLPSSSVVTSSAFCVEEACVEAWGAGTFWAAELRAWARAVPAHASTATGDRQSSRAPRAQVRVARLGIMVILPAQQLSSVVKIGPFAGLNKTGPVERMLAALVPQHRKLRLTQCLTAAQALLQSRVVGGHHLAGHVVAHRPQAHHQGFGAGQKKRTPKSVDALAILYFA